MKKSLMILLTVMICCSAFGSNELQRQIVRVDQNGLSRVMALMSQSDKEALDIVGRNQLEGTLDILLRVDRMSILDRYDISWTPVKTSDQIRDDRIDPQFLDYSEVTTALAGYQTSYPTRMQRYDLATTAEGRHVWAMKISDNVTIDEDEPEILILAQHQAREIMSTEIAMDIINYLAVNYGSNIDVTRWVNEWEIWVVPMMNPDGSAYCWSTDQYWIKNRRDLGGGVYGVDLGHNYPFRWGDCFGSSSDPNSNSYRGPGPASESEVQAITALTDDHRFAVVLSFNSFDEFVLCPYGCYGDLAPDHDIVNYFGSSFASLIQRDDGTTGYSTGTWWQLLYANDGNETDYFYATHGAYSYAVEVNQSTYYPTYTVRTQTVQRNRAGWQKVLNLFENCPVVYGHVTDACTGQPVQAQYYIDEYPLTENENPRTSDPSTGRYTQIVKPGSYTLVFFADGYLDKFVPVNLSTDPIPLDVQMIPYGQPGLLIWGTEINDSTGDNDWQIDPGETVILRVSLYAPEVPITGISGILSTSDSYITITDNSTSWPNIAGGQTQWSSGNSFSIRAASSTPEGHAAQLTITFTADQTLCDTTDQCTVIVRTYTPLCPYWEETMDSNPNWTITSYPTSGSPAGPYNNWEWGIPQVGPAGAYTGTYLYGTGLDGNYDNSWTLCLTTPAIDCSDLTNTTLKFARYLLIEADYDHGRVRIRNVPGGSWTTIQNLSTSDSSWTQVEMDISQYADGEDSVEIRFDVQADSSINAPGYYLDDVMICGDYAGSVPPQPTPTIRPTRTPTSIPSQTPVPSFTPTPPTNTPTFPPTPTSAPSQPTNTPITPTNTPTQIPPSPTPTPIPPTPTPTSIPGEPTHTPAPTSTPEPTRTPEPTDTVKPTETPTPVSTNVPTVTPPPTHTPPPSPTSTTATPTSTPVQEMFAINVTLNDDFYSAGEQFLLQCEVIRHGPAVTVDQYIILDVYGIYFFWPGWTQEADHESFTYTNGYHKTSSIMDFTWPSVDGHAENITFYAGCLYSGTLELIGEISFASFAY